MPRATRSSVALSSRLEVAKEPQQLSSPPATPDVSNTARRSRRTNAKANGKQETSQQPPSTPANSSRKRSRKAAKQEEGDVNGLPHGLGTALPTPGLDEASPTRLKKRARKVENYHVSDAEGKLEDEVKPTPAKKPPKKANYGFTPGISPYPDYLRPTPEECEEVVRLLEEKHGKVVVPKAIPPPSLDVAGCGEVPSVLDALIRTLLSASTTSNNSSTAFRGLVSRFGTLKEGVGKGSVDWDAVRQAPHREVFKAIERGGLAQVKSKNIQKILQMVYEENQERKNALMNPFDNPAGARHEPEGAKQEEIAKAKQNIISLDHLHFLSTNDAIEKMLSYPGIGLKTASCVALFCLQRPSFAVDTHVFRLSQYLGWVPPTAQKGQPPVTRNTTYSHCDARIPDPYKYPLHQLLIRHGKACPRCRAATGTTSARWHDGCPIEHLVTRHGHKKGATPTAARQKAHVDAADDAEPEGTPEEAAASELLSDVVADEEE